MLYKDTSNIPFVSGGCDVIIDNQTIKEFNGVDTVQTYKLVGNTFYLTEEQPYTEPDGRQYLTCQDQTTIQTLPSNYDFIEPIYSSMAIVSAVVIFYFAYKLILSPFWRKRT